MSQSASQIEMPDLQDFLCFAVYSANNAFGRLYKPLLDDLGLTYPQYLVMVTLWERDTQTVGAIGHTLFLGSNTLTPLLKRLEALGYIQRERDSQDERRVLVHVTKRGRDLQQKATCVPQRLGETLGLTVGDVAGLRADLVSLRDRLMRAAGEESQGSTPRTQVPSPVRG